MTVNQEFWKAVMELDLYKCASPFCEIKKDLGHRILDVHHLLGKKHEKPEEGITLCRRCHDKCENGWNIPKNEMWRWRNLFADIGLSPVVTRLPGRELEIIILTWYQICRPENFRWGVVLEEFYKKRKVV